MDKEHKYVFASRSNLKLPYYNAKMLAPEKVKRTSSSMKNGLPPDSATICFSVNPTADRRDRSAADRRIWRVISWPSTATAMGTTMSFRHRSLTTSWRGTKTWTAGGISGRSASSCSSDNPLGFDRSGPIVRIDELLSDGRLRIGQESGLAPLVVAAEFEDAETAIDRMRAHGVRRLPVVDDTGAVFGIVTLDDLYRVLAERTSALVAITTKEQTREHRGRR